MTPTTPEQARELARDAALDFGCIRRAIGSLADQIEALTKELDNVKAAAKLALDALSNHGFPYLGHTAEYEKAEAALRQAGVQ